MLSCYGVKTLSQRPQRRLEGGPRTLPPPPVRWTQAQRRYLRLYARPHMTPCASACIWTREPAFGSPLGELGMRGVREPNVQAAW